MTTPYALGAILLRNGLLTQTQLDEALQQQQEQASTIGWRLLGEILVESRLLTKQELADAIEWQSKLIEIEFFGLRTHPSTHSAFKRSVDVVGAIAGLSLTLGLLPFIALAVYLESPGPVLISQPRVGLRGRQFNLLRFRTTTPGAERQRLKVGTDKGRKFFDQDDDPHVTYVGRFLRRFYLDELPQFWNVLKGEMSLVGTRPPTLDEVKFYSANDWRRLAVRPGMTGLWQVNRNKYRMNFDNVMELDEAYIHRWRSQSDLKILSDTALHIVRGPKYNRIRALHAAAEINQIGILNVPIDNMSVRELLEQLKTGVVLTPNVDHLMKLQRDSDFYKTYALAEYKVCDSQILMYASRFLGTPLKEKISGSDLFPTFCDYHRHNPDITIFLMGGAAGVADRAKERLNTKLGREIIIGAHSPSFGFEKNEQECQDIVQMINASGATVLAVGVGAPKQEKWIYKYKEQLPGIKIFLAVGATIDFEAGVLKRSPKWMSKLGLEWLFRIMADPKRLWKRYLMDDLPFFWLLIKQKLGLYTPPPFDDPSASGSQGSLRRSSQFPKKKP